MLIVSILVSFITAVFGTRLLMQLLIKSPFLKKRPTWFGVKKESIKDIAAKEDKEATFMNRKINVVQHRKKFFIASTLMVVLGGISLALFQLNPGIDFTSGTRVEDRKSTRLNSSHVAISYAVF